MPVRVGDRLSLSVEGLDAMVSALRERGYEVLGPRARDGAVVYGPISGVGDLPAGLADWQAPGLYRLRPGRGGELFGHSAGAQTWRRFFQVPELRLLRARRGPRMDVLPDRPDARRQALVGVRPCDLAALAVVDRVLGEGPYADPHQAARSRASFLVAASCTRAGGTCFCASLGTGPRARAGHDVALTELGDPGGHRFLAEVGSEAGAALCAELGLPAASEADVLAAGEATERAAREMGRSLDAGSLPALLARTRSSPVYERVARRCLSCGICTLVCPTCTCTTVADVRALGGRAERWRTWDSCFTLAHSFVHGGAVRASTAARHRQWVIHKLSDGGERPGAAGCVGCGRCITWCPARIDITETVAALREAEVAARGPT